MGEENVLESHFVSYDDEANVTDESNDQQHQSPERENSSFDGRLQTGVIEHFRDLENE